VYAIACLLFHSFLAVVNQCPPPPILAHTYTHMNSLDCKGIQPGMAAQPMRTRFTHMNAPPPPNTHAHTCTTHTHTHISARIHLHNHRHTHAHTCTTHTRTLPHTFTCTTTGTPLPATEMQTATDPPLCLPLIWESPPTCVPVPLRKMLGG